jgi:outer membrane protein OmpA-like peptidoglycan-associated protein
MQKRLVITLPLAALLAMPAFSQTNQPAPTAPNQMQSQQQTPTTEDNAKQPLTLEQHEGFWGHLNPFARKKYVRKQLTPVVGRVNELDELTASNSKLIKDVDARSAEGIRQANAKATEADSHALDATNRANQANETATQATARLTNVEKAVTNIDQYAKVQDTEIRFRSGQSALSTKAKAALDQMIDPLKSQRGYVVEVQGFAPGRGQAAIASSQKMADSVVRYLVENDVPVYRIYTLGMGSAAPKVAEGEKAQRIRSGKVEITLLRNDLSGLESAQNAPAGSPAASSNVQGQQAPASALPQNDKPADQNAPKQQAPVVPKN